MSYHHWGAVPPGYPCAPRPYPPYYYRPACDPPILYFEGTLHWPSASSQVGTFSCYHAASPAVDLLLSPLRVEAPSATDWYLSYADRLFRRHPQLFDALSEAALSDAFHFPPHCGSSVETSQRADGATVLRVRLMRREESGGAATHRDGLPSHTIAGTSSRCSPEAAPAFGVAEHGASHSVSQDFTKLLEALASVTRGSSSSSSAECLPNPSVASGLAPIAASLSSAFPNGMRSLDPSVGVFSSQLTQKSADQSRNPSKVAFQVPLDGAGDSLNSILNGGVVRSRSDVKIEPEEEPASPGRLGSAGSLRAAFGATAPPVQATLASPSQLAPDRKILQSCRDNAQVSKKSTATAASEWGIEIRLHSPSGASGLSSRSESPPFLLTPPGSLYQSRQSSKDKSETESQSRESDDAGQGSASFEFSGCVVLPIAPRRKSRDAFSSEPLYPGAPLISPLGGQGGMLLFSPTAAERSKSRSHSASLTSSPILTSLVPNPDEPRGGSLSWRRNLPALYIQKRGQAPRTTITRGAPEQPGGDDRGPQPGCASTSGGSPDKEPAEKTPSSELMSRLASPITRMPRTGILRPLPGAFSTRRTVVFMDWDDTLCPTTWIRSLLKETMADREEWEEWFSEVPPWFNYQLPEDPGIWDRISELQEAVMTVLRVAQSYGIVCIVTNGVEGWVEKTIIKWLPQLRPYIMGYGVQRMIHVLYAQSFWKHPAQKQALEGHSFVDFLGPHMWWKQAAMSYAIENIDELYRMSGYDDEGSWVVDRSTRRLVNIISLGDSEAEMQAAEIIAEQSIWTHTEMPRKWQSKIEKETSLQVMSPKLAPPATTRWQNSSCSSSLPPNSRGSGRRPWVKLAKLADDPAIRILCKQLYEFASLLPEIVAARQDLRVELSSAPDKEEWPCTVQPIDSMLSDERSEIYECLSPVSPLALRTRRQLRHHFMNQVDVAELALERRLRVQTV